MSKVLNNSSKEHKVIMRPPNKQTLKYGSRINKCRWPAPKSIFSRVVEVALSILDLVKDAFDNDATPWYAITICLWSTVFLELWKRKNAVLAYEWDVDQFEDTEPDRPEFFGKFYWNILLFFVISYYLLALSYRKKIFIRI